MTEYEKIKSLLDELNIPYEEVDCDHWKNSIDIPSKENIINDLNKFGAKGLDIKTTLGFGCCNFIFTKNTEFFIGVETE